MDASSPYPLFTRDQIQEAVRRLTAWTVQWMELKGLRALNLISVLEGAGPLTRDIIEKLEILAPGIKIQIHPLRARGTAGRTLLEERELREEELDWDALRTHPVLILDDLLDSGKTLKAIQKRLTNKGVTDFKTAVLIRKYADSPTPVDFCGFHLDLNREALAAQGLKDYWLFGYGMDWDGRFRELDHVAWLEVR
jgi:hypoxanthine phosphoribosyltransferase